jgi:hypothetical protein
MTPPIFLLFLVLQPQNWGENQIKAGGSSFFFVDSERKEWGGGGELVFIVRCHLAY